MHIAATAFATLRNNRAVTGHDEVRERLAAVFLEDDRAGRDAHDDVVGAVPVLFLAAARLAVFRDQTRLIFEIEQSREAFIDLEDYAAAAPALPPAGPPNGRYFSRKNAIAPFPPFPACTNTLASSINRIALQPTQPSGDPSRPPQLWPQYLCRGYDARPFFLTPAEQCFLGSQRIAFTRTPRSALRA